MGKLSRESVIRIFTEALGLGVALACIGWVLGHLIVFFSLGYVLVGENSRGVLLAEITVTSLGLLCFVATFCKYRFSSKK